MVQLQITDQYRLWKKCGCRLGTFFSTVKYQAEQRFGRNYFKENRMKKKKNFANNLI
jgi:hypothetical protein